MDNFGRKCKIFGPKQRFNYRGQENQIWPQNSRKYHLLLYTPWAKYSGNLKGEHFSIIKSASRTILVFSHVWTKVLHFLHFHAQPYSPSIPLCYVTFPHIRQVRPVSGSHNPPQPTPRTNMCKIFQIWVLGEPCRGLVKTTYVTATLATGCRCHSGIADTNLVIDVVAGTDSGH
jgi:hypothetical protein